MSSDRKLESLRRRQKLLERGSQRLQQITQSPISRLESAPKAHLPPPMAGAEPTCVRLSFFPASLMESVYVLLRSRLLADVQVPSMRSQRQSLKTQKLTPVQLFLEAAPSTLASMRAVRPQQRLRSARTRTPIAIVS